MNLIQHRQASGMQDLFAASNLRGGNRVVVRDKIATAIKEAVVAEREACAKVAKGFTTHQDDLMGLPTQGDTVAAAIRARKD